ncbi:unnamed protein product [Phyllotreta striolata]|uniref:Uncharacterized protein n=1 Tax=Phyllotreta striolata TaxID=444603 RepID=A0A9N9XIZ7_PHYSR|nr:unnamed protein product [Phyllotreta striolata]
MFCKLKIVALIFFVNFQLIENAPLMNGVCSKFNCTTGTAACSILTSTTSDRKNINQTIICYEANGEILSNKTTTEPNTNPNLIINSFNFYGSFELRSDGNSTDLKESVFPTLGNVLKIVSLPFLNV